MKLKYSHLILLMAGVAGLSSCKMFGGKSGESSTTGWRYNDPNYGGFEVVMDYTPKTGPGLVFVEGGTFIMGRVEQDVMYDWNSTPRRVTVASFYMDETEVKNVDYREYLFWLRRVYVAYPQVYKNALPDTLVWRSPMGFNDPYVTNYFRHPAYNDHPVVGVSWLKASDYCLWRSDRVNEMLLVKGGWINLDLQQKDHENFNTDAYLLGKYEASVRNTKPSLKPGEEQGRQISFEDGILLPKYRLPTEAEWEFAASGLIGNTYDERIVERRIYPWNGHNVRNSSSRNRGEIMANFVRGRGDYMGVAGNLNDKELIPGPVKSYWPNDFGLYCMAGNVSEWVLDVYRPLTFQDMDEFRPFRGNVFQELDLNPDGSVKNVDSLGRIRYRDVTPENAANRRNYNKAYYINHLDGDVASSILDWEDVEGFGSTSDKMYYQGQTTRQDRPNDGMTTLINDRVRVYKGGSWKDRAYWLSPGTRRFLDEASSQSDLGFRCAMEAVGSQTAGKRR
ncbi:MAG TPA: SUMF1/EgtB/PvdO family nonheme iron enzyme [Tenuifilaceae bacterium]|jgi:gliding motility-associated lipoprotein GldJ|nr:SUMF1/EgtB/PvdO family nonheme iron enzyme [Bacteroidales bacterium]MDI9516256.1 SUMF1/EgtB/PvdO family nonheme iron enzyme [Bacteroidota bacterium]OQC64958.1 MAG: Formylglycine-generating sulfatase enzyme [Bacteroidetes bacterium ADurb.Bin008]HNV80440.1 SUMF1/EgtB/PvdO family nonheme iron enzyme [Tenuifilaceae bacterium]MZP82507.1 SUMF1/EgtB/PvdO family nonheme iron enzyme [Bacteroidales bacterium]